MKKKSSGNKKTVPANERFSKLTLLKISRTRISEGPEKAKLEVFSNIYAGRDYEIVFDCPEFTSLCPVTGQPDFGAITIRYIPGRYCIESKSLKLYLFSFRNHNTFHEEAVNSIFDAVMKTASPRWAEVSGIFNPRGGIAIKVKVSTDKGCK